MKTTNKSNQTIVDKSKTVENSTQSLSVEALTSMLQQAQQAKISQATKTIKKLAEENNLSVGVTLDIQKITDILHFMINNNKPIVNLQFEVWGQ